MGTLPTYIYQNYGNGIWAHQYWLRPCSLPIGLPTGRLEQQLGFVHERKILFYAQSTPIIADTLGTVIWCLIVGCDENDLISDFTSLLSFIFEKSESCCSGEQSCNLWKDPMFKVAPLVKQNTSLKCFQGVCYNNNKTIKSYS